VTFLFSNVSFYGMREGTTWLHCNVKSLGMSHRDLKTRIREEGSSDEVSVSAVSSSCRGGIDTSRILHLAVMHLAISAFNNGR